MDITLTEKDMCDPVASMFRVSAQITEHILRRRQACVGREVDLGQGISGVVLSADSKNVTIKASSGERRVVPITPRRAYIIQRNGNNTPRSAAPRARSPRRSAASPIHASEGRDADARRTAGVTDSTVKS